MKDQTCCFTGHRDLTDSDIQWISRHLSAEIETLIQIGVRRFVAGGARGFDTHAPLKVQALKKKYPQIELILALPCENQTRGWPEADRLLYRDILQFADQTVFLSHAYYPGCMQKRNRYLVEQSRYLICYVKRDTGGSAYTLRYAQQHGLVIRNLADTENLV